MIVGADEAGRGPVLGPLVVAAVAIPVADLQRLIDLGVDDSKALSPKKREELSQIIHEEPTWQVSIIECSPERIDLTMETKTLNDLEVDLFGEAINGLDIERIEELILDACDTNEARFGRNVTSRISSVKVVESVISKHGADADNPVAGAASIVAKVHRDKVIESIAKDRGFNVGSGYPSDPNTQSVLPILLSQEQPDPDLRWGWKTVKRQWSDLGRGLPPKRSDFIEGRRQSRIDQWSSASVKSEADTPRDESDDF
ncbi:MAG TPA: ribonuclease HII [Candidatus Thalassarchaeaceae archaeon]|nr:ribonuclease HII [Candidatus Thalassarchaeaceae archaeon]|tara:strand:+ start:752 stop:1522 length:771 start_codon:yes stop_codon:yes gene_type:complete